MQAVLSAKCWVCHGRTRCPYQRESTLRGGKSGSSVVGGNPDGSLLVARFARPFSVRGLPDAELDTIKRWIDAGTPALTETAIAFNSSLQSECDVGCGAWFPHVQVNETRDDFLFAYHTREPSNGFRRSRLTPHDRSQRSNVNIAKGNRFMIALQHDRVQRRLGNV